MQISCSSVQDEMQVKNGAGQVLENAVSNRSRCRVCRKAIPKGDLRIGFRPDPLSTSLHYLHVRCAKLDPFDWAELAEAWPETLDLAGVDRIRARYAVPHVDPQTVVAAQGATRLTLLRDLWAATRDPMVAELVQQANRLALQRDPMPADIPRGWVETLDRADPTRTGHRIRAAARGTKSVLTDAVRNAWTEAPDPRWADLVLPWFERPPFADAPALWAAALGLLDRLADPRVFEALPPRGEPRGLRYGIATRHVAEWQALRAERGFPTFTRPVQALTERDRHGFEDLREGLDLQAIQVADARDEDAQLLHRGAAGDDVALLIWADRLLVSGDVRGELIQLELAKKRQRTSAQSQRRRALKKNWRALLGGLAPALLKDGLRFRRGLVIGAVARVPPEPDLQSVLHSVDWASVERLELRPDARGRVAHELVFAPHARRLRFLVLPDLRSMSDICNSYGVQPAVTEVEILDTYDRFWGALTTHALPNLQRVVAPRIEGLERRLPHLEIVRG